jgi:hypothetical protein
MARIQSLLLTSAVLGGLVGCSQSTPPKASPSSATLAALTYHLSETKMAVTAGNFEQGKSEFSRFKGIWGMAQDDIKAKAGSTIEKGMDKVDSGLKAKDSATTLAGLKVLSESLVAARP